MKQALWAAVPSCSLETIFVASAPPHKKPLSSSAVDNTLPQPSDSSFLQMACLGMPQKLPEHDTRSWSFEEKVILCILGSSFVGQNGLPLTPKTMAQTYNYYMASLSVAGCPWATLSTRKIHAMFRQIQKPADKSGARQMYDMTDVEDAAWSETRQDLLSSAEHVGIKMFEIPQERRRKKSGKSRAAGSDFLSPLKTPWGRRLNK
ncbi:hypothetical protein MMC09_002258 [Bachmanniomyces sp. S44760]|nr:hypothetical protein [Bachmanniomyces sp. S44760]